MRSVEGEGSTIDDAIARALAALGVGRDEVEIDILENASRGVLGIGRRKARVRATVRTSVRSWISGEDDVGERLQACPVIPSADAAGEAGPDAVATGVDGAAVLRDILRMMVIDASVVAADGQRGAQVLSVEGPESAQLVGRRGEVLDALEYLINRMAEAGGRQSRRFVLDADGYRAKRRASLEQMARRLAERARRRGKPVTVNPLSPSDRRTVYLALQSENGIAARSVGQGFYRRLVIIPGRGGRGGGKAVD
jgi:spoIIIJ-associated protein